MTYAYRDESEGKLDVPRGQVSRHPFKSEIFPGTERDYWLYVPAQYTGCS